MNLDLTLWRSRSSQGLGFSETGTSVNSAAITYTHKSRQYVTVASGLGGGLATRYGAAKVPAAAPSGHSRR